MGLARCLHDCETVLSCFFFLLCDRLHSHENYLEIDRACDAFLLSSSKHRSLKSSLA